MAIQTQEFRITGMTCGHCENSVNRAVLSLGDGIVSVKADKDAASASVTYDDAKVTAEQIKAAVNDTGIYEAV